MLARTFFAVAIGALVILLFAAAPALATVKCQCNNGMIVQDVGADADDPDADDSCNDACSEGGGGSVWTPGQDDNDDVEGRRDDRVPAHPIRR
jgi:hypothetical protein